MWKHLLNRYLLSLFLFSLLDGATALAQKPYFLIQTVKTKKEVKVRRGQFIQCIQENAFGQEEFLFGEVVTVRHDGVKLRDNPFIPGSGGFAFYEDIVNIEKIKVIKRGMLPACIGGIILGELLIAFPLMKPFTGPLIAVADYYVLVRALKRKRRSLYANRVPETVVLIPPGIDVQEDHYFKPSSSLNQPE